MEKVFHFQTLSVIPLHHSHLNSFVSLINCSAVPLHHFSLSLLLQKNDSGGERHKKILFTFPKHKKENKYVVQLFI